MQQLKQQQDESASLDKQTQADDTPGSERDAASRLETLKRLVNDAVQKVFHHIRFGALQPVIALRQIANTLDIRNRINDGKVTPAAKDGLSPNEARWTRTYQGSSTGA